MVGRYNSLRAKFTYLSLCPLSLLNDTLYNVSFKSILLYDIINGKGKQLFYRKGYNAIQIK
jgi:hypothetical protein